MSDFIENTKLVLLSNDDYNWTCNHSFNEIELFGGIDSERWISFKSLFNDEVWKSANICGFENYYVSNYGRVYQKEYTYNYINRYNSETTVIQKPKILRNVILQNGYYNVNLYIDHTRKSIYVHRLVCYLFN